MSLAALVARYGLVAVGLGAAFEGEAAVIAGGLLAHQGLVPLAGVMAVAAVGSFAADQGWFAVGRRFRTARWVTKARGTTAFGRAIAALERHPVGFVFAFRFLYGLRTVSPIAIGTSGVPARLFVTVNAVAAVVWAVLFSSIGYLFGNAFERAIGRLHPHEPGLWWIVAGLIGLGVVAIWGRRRWVSR